MCLRAWARFVMCPLVVEPPAACANGSVRRFGVLWPSGKLASDSLAKALCPGGGWLRLPERARQDMHIDIRHILVVL